MALSLPSPTLRKLPPFISLSESNSFPLFNRTPLRPLTSPLPILSNSNFSSSTDDLVHVCRCASEAGDLGLSDFDDHESPHALPHHLPDNSPDTWHVLGLGQAMVDFSGMVDDEFLNRLGLEKGTRKVVNHEERGRILRAMDGCSYKAAAGGSLSNTLVALARLGAQPIGGPSLNVAMAGSVGSDPLGGFYRSKLRRANVNFLSPPVKDGTTGTVIVLTTPDAQRTMLAYQVSSISVNEQFKVHVSVRCSALWGIRRYHCDGLLFKTTMLTWGTGDVCEVGSLSYRHYNEVIQETSNRREMDPLLCTAGAVPFPTHTIE